MQPLFFAAVWREKFIFFTFLHLQPTSGRVSKYISTLFKKHYRVGVVEYIRSVRLAHACRLLEEGTLSVSQVAEASVFRDALYFSRVFKKIVGLSPRAYREKKETE